MGSANKNIAEVGNTTSASETNSNFSSLEKEFYNAEKNKDIKKMVKIYHELLKIGFGGTNWCSEFEFS